jgi:glycosyltransferase involved in cell wall biosynthesis
MITLNEEDNIRNAIRSVCEWANEIVVLDMHSDDRTADIACELGARVFLHDRVAAFDGARADAVSHATGEWILLLDADEMIPQPLSCLLMKLAEEGDADVFKVPRLTHIHGCPVWFTGWGPDQDKQIRLFRRGKVILSARIHGFIQPMPGARVEVMTFRDGLAIQHFSYIDTADFIERLNRYTTVEAEQAFERRQHAGKVKAILHTFLEFSNRYIRRRGYRDGWRGFYLSGLYAMYRYTVYAKLQELYSTGGRQNIIKMDSNIADKLLARYDLNNHGPEHTLGGKSTECGAK